MEETGEIKNKKSMGSVFENYAEAWLGKTQYIIRGYNKISWVHKSQKRSWDH